MADSKKREMITTVAVLLVIVLIVAGAMIFTKKPESTAKIATTSSTTTTPTTQTTTPATATETTNTTSASQPYKDGSYTASGSYSSPGGQASIKVTVTLKDGVVTDTSAEEGPADRESKEYQDEFVNSYKSLVVGKAISSLSLSRVSGSSLTSKGFNNAIQQIKAQAQA